VVHIPDFGKGTTLPIFIIKQNTAYVYIITNKINGKKYIGSSRKSQIDENYYGSGKVIKNALKKYGKNNFTRDILWQGEGDARDIEHQWLEYFHASTNPSFYNLTNDAKGNNLHKEETKKTISEKLTGVAKHSFEQKHKWSQERKGIPNPKGGGKGILRPQTSQKHKGRISPNKGKGKQINLYKITGEYIKTYSSYHDLAIDIQINPETVRCQLIGKAKTICNKKYVAKYL
jgi:group I intron endonuclease